LKSDILEKLIKVPLFKDIPASELRTIINTFRFGIKRFVKDETILSQGAKYESLYIITDGTCIGEMLDFSGKVIKVEDLPSFFPLASGVLFSEINELPVSIIASSDTQIITIPKSDVLKLCKKNDKFLENFLSDISDKVTFLTQRLSFMCFKCIKAKVAHYLLSRSGGKDIFTLPNTLEELAVYFGVARPSLSRVFKEMENDGLIKKDGRDVSIKDRDKLAKYVE
jgi:CRP/FNR family transcriptional regulator, dissimilatory nitrate respiration regulator